MLVERISRKTERRQLREYFLERYLLDYITREAKEPRQLSYLREISVPLGAGPSWYMDCAYAYGSIMYKLENAYDQERTNNAEQINLFKP